VVYSDEPRRSPLPHQPVGGDTPGRPRAVNGTISYLPALFGVMVAGFIIRRLLGEGYWFSLIILQAVDFKLNRRGELHLDSQYLPP
jgi:hypothetical protein